MVYTKKEGTIRATEMKYSVQSCGKRHPWCKICRPDLISKHSQACADSWNGPNRRADMSLRQRGKILSPEHCKDISNALKGRPKSPEHCAKFSTNLKTRWQDPEYRQKIVSATFAASHIRPNKTEIRLQILLDKLFPGQYQYVGDGQLILGGCCPDFANVNGQKKLIELYGDYWHAGEDPQNRMNHFAQFGFKTLIVWEHELENLQELEQKLFRYTECETELFDLSPEGDAETTAPQSLQSSVILTN